MVFDQLSGRATGTVVYRNVALIDGTGAAARDAVSIVVAGERIDAILPKDARLPDEARIAGHERS